MPALAFDTYKAVKALQAAGADESLAEAVVTTVGEAVGGNVATKADLAEVQAGLEIEIGAVKTEVAEAKAELKTEIAEVKAELKTEIAEVKAELKTEIAEVKTELKTEIVTLREDMLKGQQDMLKGQQDMLKGQQDMLKGQQDMSHSIQGVYRLMVMAILTITSTIIGAAIALVRYLAP